MKKRHGAAALLLPLVLAAPLKAQGAAGIRGDNGTIAGPSYIPPQEGRTSYLPIRDEGSGINLSTVPIVQQDGSAVYRKTLVGTLPLSSDVSVGVGLIEVTRTSIKERALARTRPLSDTGGRSD
jgi:hypothetical protein